ncbi:MAG: RNA ligase family protein [Bacteroidota bacterium]
MKPLGHKAYGSIPHLPGSKRGPGDKGLTAHQAAILTDRMRPGDRIYVTEKLDGSNVAVAKIVGQIVPLGRAGYRAETSRQRQHQLFADYVFRHWAAFDSLLDEGERVCGEWLAMAHSIRYDLHGRPPLAAFDLMREHDRVPYARFVQRTAGVGDVMGCVPLIHQGGPLSVAEAIALVRVSQYGAVDAPEGVVYRVERHGVCDFLGKYVRPDFVPGRLFARVTGKAEVWNWAPDR